VCSMAEYFHQVCTRAKYYKDELLCSCFKFVFSVPETCVSLPVILPIVKNALKIGVSHVETATIVIGALERWAEKIPEELNRHLESIVPYLEPYLHVGESVSDELEIPESMRKASKAVQNNRDHLSDVTLRILYFLGRIGGRNSEGLLARWLALWKVELKSLKPC